MDPTLLIGDIVERESDVKKKPLETDFSDKPLTSTGFPEHKKRWQGSAFKQRRAGGDAPKSAFRARAEEQEAANHNVIQPQMSFDEIEKKRIDQENRQRLEDMSPQEIAQAQEDLMSGLNPALVKRLLQRATIDESPRTSPFDQPTTDTHSPSPVPEIRVDDTTRQEPQEKPAPSIARAVSSKKIAEDYDEDREPTQMPPDLFPITDPPKSTHFPAAPRVADLDPNDPNFLESLHEKYFPDLPADPSKLAWMAPVPSEHSTADQDSPYYPHPEIAVSALRFDFRGRFLSPRVSRSISSAVGLHHHGEAPEAAGYTVAEMARLARSAVPAQRCIAFQTLGRVLYRLGKGEWGKTEEHPIAMGVWNSVKQSRVLDTLNEEAMKEGGHRSSKAFAMEALWLFEKGGWREQHKGR